jgi:UDP-2,3-diacylglucosamine hydrolase
VVLFLSDLHLGRGSAAESEAAEADALDLLDAHFDAAVEAGPLGGLVLVGDVFDQYIEYQHLVPKGFVRLLGRLAAWADAGVPVLYAVGNRDPWHRSFFQREIGVRLFYDPVFTRVGGRQIYLAHGDGFIPGERVYNRLKPFLRHPALTALYRAVLPADVGYGLARWVGRRSKGTRAGGAPDTATAQALHQHARAVLDTTPAEVAVLGHVHQEACMSGPGGTYLNPGYWFGHRTYGLMDPAGVHLLCWTAEGGVPLSRPAPTALAVL